MKNLINSLKEDLIYTINPKEYNRSQLIDLLKIHPEIKFVSLVGIDLAGNDTDEKIPISNFYEDIDEFLNGSIQTDGSSVVLPNIATLNNGKIDIVPDKESKWFVDYNYENIDAENGRPIGSLRVPSFLIHNNKEVDSRSVLKNAVNNFKKSLLDIFRNSQYICDYFKIDFQDISDILMTSATELEFWVKTPNDKADIEALSVSQVLQEQYWKRTRGVVRTALEQSLMIMGKYGLSPEMGHKEVGGILAQLDDSGNLNHIMEQLEIDWKYDNSLQAADNDLLVRILVNEVFRKNGLEVTFQAKPIEGVAGNGKHIHVGAALKLKNGEIINLFSAIDSKEDFISPIGYGALMGLLKNYEAVNPFISSTIDSLNRLKPGFEAPICIVSSLGHDIETPSRNRTVLVGLIRDMKNMLSTRFEVRSPNPLTNSYLSIAAIYQTMLDGIKAVVTAEKSLNELEKEITKAPNEAGFYLEYGRAYRSEEDVFEHYTLEERNNYFGIHPSTVYENIKNLKSYPDKIKTLMNNNVMDYPIIESFSIAAISRWTTEILNRMLPQHIDFVRSCKPLHQTQNPQDLDISYWTQINELRNNIMKDTLNYKSLCTKIREAAINKNYELLSVLQIEIKVKIDELNKLYSLYKRNLIDL